LNSGGKDFTFATIDLTNPEARVSRREEGGGTREKEGEEEGEIGRRKGEEEGEALQQLI
jgi:hypothetical protein